MKSIFFTFLVSFFLMYACTSDPLKDLSDADSQVFITNYDKTAPFTAYKTFAVSDSVYILQNQRTAVSSTRQDLIYIARIAENLQNKGYKQVKKNESPDLGMTLARVTNSRVGVSSTPYYGYYGYGSYYSPSYYSFYQVSDSYWYIEMLDLKNLTPDNKYKVVWNAEIRGYNVFDPTVSLDIIDAVFAQSPYLKAK
jgi:hypothetical protein